MIEALPPVLVDDILADRCLPIVGAGFSRNATLPGAVTMPDWPALGMKFQASLGSYRASGAIDAISAFEEQFGRPRLIEELWRHLHIEAAEPGSAHEAFCRFGFSVVLTTNFDFLLEEGCRKVNRACVPVIEEAQLSVAVPRSTTRLLKFHGDLNHPSRLVATEADYDTFLEGSPLLATFAGNLLLTRTPLLLGYSFDDADTRGIWALLKARLGNMRRAGFVLSVNPSATDIARFERRGFSVIALPAEDHAEAYTQLFAELKDEYDLRFGAVSVADDESVATEMALPLGASQNLCFVSVAREAYGWYRGTLVPLFRSRGLAPTGADDITAPGPLQAALDALLRRCAFAIVEVDDAAQQLEARVALEHLGSSRVVLVARDIDHVPSDLQHLRFFRRPDDLEMLGTNLAVELLSAVESVVARSSASEQAQELFAMGQWGAAVIAAVSALDEATSRLVEGRTPPLSERLKQLRSRDGRIDNEWPVIADGIGVRNVLVHRPSDAAVPEKEFVRRLLTAIDRVINILEESQQN